MKFTKHQKEIIRHIYEKDIYDILSYIKFFNLGKKIKFNQLDIINKFNADNIPKTYYCYNKLKCSSSNILTEVEYQTRLTKDEINPENYVPYTLKLNSNSGVKHETWKNSDYVFDFYDGVYLANSFDDILDFLTVWQFLSSEMLILEVPQELSPETLGLFYYPKDNTFSIDNSTSEQIKNINFDNFTYDDKHYIDKDYILSHEHCIMFEKYLNKKILPSAKLGTFISKNFMTYEEQTQNRALFVAWVAVFVSIILTFIPYFRKEDNYNLKCITQNMEEIKNIISGENHSKKIIEKLNIIIEKINTQTGYNISE